jgi:hypothetical protein
VRIPVYLVQLALMVASAVIVVVFLWAIWVLVALAVTR